MQFTNLKLITPTRIDNAPPAVTLRLKQRQAVEAARLRNQARDDVQLNGWLQKKAQQVKSVARKVFVGITIPARLVVNAVAPNSKLATSKQNLKEAAVTTIKVAAVAGAAVLAAPYAAGAVSSIGAGMKTAGAAVTGMFKGGSGATPEPAYPIDIPSVTTPTVPEIVNSALTDYLSPKPQALVDRPVDLSAPVEVPRGDLVTVNKKFSMSDIPPWALVGGGLLVLSMMKG